MEVQAPYGYVLNSEPVYFDVTQDALPKKAALRSLRWFAPIWRRKGTITVSKSGEVFTSVSENNGMYQPYLRYRGLKVRFMRLPPPRIFILWTER